MNRTFPIFEPARRQGIARIPRGILISTGVLCTLIGCLLPSESALAQARVIPQLDCIDVELREIGPDDHESEAGPWVIAHLGYSSEFPTNVTIPLGEDNFFTPGTPDRGQPSTFLAGQHPSVFTVEFNSLRISTLSWWLSAQNVDGGGAGTTLSIGNNPADYCELLIAAVSPETGMQGELLNMTLSGGPFAPGYQVRLRQGTFAIEGTTLETDYSSLLAEFLIPESAPLGTYDVEVVDVSDNVVTSPAGFELLGSLEINALVMAADGSAIYAGTAALGVFKSTDGGTSWQAVNDGMDDLRVRSLLADPSNPQVVYAGTRDGIFKTVDGGQSWTEMSDGLPGPTAGTP